MKRIVVLLLSLTFGAISNASAQVPVRVGLLGGINLANATTSPSLSSTARTGMIVGGSVEIRISDMFSLEPQVSYVQKGARYSVSFFGQEITSVFKFDYLDVPVLLKARLLESDLVPYVFAGPDIGFNLSSQGEMTAFGQTQTEKIDSTSSIDFSLDFGAGAEYSLGPRMALTGDIRYSLGLTNVSTSSSATWKSNGFQFMVGFKVAIM